MLTKGIYTVYQLASYPGRVGGKTSIPLGLGMRLYINMQCIIIIGVILY